MAPQRRERTVRLPGEIARRVREGHPWVFEDFLRGRQLEGAPGDAFTLLDPMGHFLARAVLDPSGPLALRVFSRRPEATLEQRAIRELVGVAARWRRRLLDVGPTSCIRVLSGDNEGLPAVNVDRYGAHLVVCLYSGVAERFESDLITALVEEWQPHSIYVQRRYRPAPSVGARPGAELVHGEPAPPEVVVEEGRTRFVVDVTAPLGTGLFADMRCGREAVARYAAGRRVLNCFSYTGAFSVVAALHGARTVTSVDSASRAHARARRNFAENQLDAAFEGYEFVTGDSFATMARYASHGRDFDLAVVDPPTFSTGKGRVFTAFRDYAELSAAALNVLSSGGILCAASNASKLSAEDLERAVGEGADQAGCNVLVLERLGQPVDYPVLPGFPEGRYLKVVIARVERTNRAAGTRPPASRRS